MSNPEIPDIARRGDDLIARIDELCHARGIDPNDYSKLNFAGNGWIYVLIACRMVILDNQQWKDIAKGMIPTTKALTEALAQYQQLAKTIHQMCDAVIIPKHLVDAECVCTACGHHGDDTEARHCYECGCRNEDDKGNCTQCRKGTMVSTCPQCGPYSTASNDAYVPFDTVHEDYIQDVIALAKASRKVSAE